MEIPRFNNQQLEFMASQAELAATAEDSIKLGSSEDIFTQQRRVIDAAKLHGVALGLRMAANGLTEVTSGVTGRVLIDLNPGTEEEMDYYDKSIKNSTRPDLEGINRSTQTGGPD